MNDDHSKPQATDALGGGRNRFLRPLLPALIGACLTASTATTAQAAIYWNLFNAEDEQTSAPAFVTYASASDMLRDLNRTGVFVPNGFGGGAFAQNIVGTGSDGVTYWTLFNVEDEQTTAPAFVTYSNQGDMLRDINRTGVFVPNGFAGGGFAQNIVGTGSDGSTYWTLFNVENEQTTAPAFVTYANLSDMLLDINRTGNFVPDGFAGGAFAGNVVGTGGGFFGLSSPVPEPSAWSIMLLGFIALGTAMRSSRRKQGPALACPRSASGRRRRPTLPKRPQASTCLQADT